MINQYIKTVLNPTLKNRDIPNDIIEIIQEDVTKRLTSVISVWSDIPFRNAILTLGREEAEFYQPEKKNILIRSLVVVGIRNSLIEDLHSETLLSFYVEKLQDKDIEKITKDAIIYFSRFNLNKEAKKLKGYKSVFHDLAERYPAAWKALEMLGQLKDMEKNYQSVPITRESIELLKPFLFMDNNHFLDPDKKIQNEIQSGIDNRISESMFLQLRDCNYIVTDCFKTFTRNPEKLLAMMEFLFKKNAPIVTSNFFIENGYVSQANQFIEPSFGTQFGVISNLKKRIEMKGISNTHMEMLSNYIEQMETTTAGEKVHRN